MVKQLLIIRHAEAKDSQSNFPDVDRDLTARGYQDAVRIGNHLTGENWQPALFLSSPANRALGTAQMISEQLHYPLQHIQTVDELYEGSPRTFLSVVNKQNDKFSKIAVVGHNPTVTYLLEYLTGEEVSNVVPGGMAMLEFSVESWQEVSQRTGTLMWYKIPENI